MLVFILFYGLDWVATVPPTALFAGTGLTGAEGLAAEVEREMVGIVDEAAGKDRE